MAFSSSNIPNRAFATLFPLRFWCCWQEEYVLDQSGQPKIDSASGQPIVTKIPYVRAGRKASSTDRSSWRERAFSERQARTLEKPTGNGGVGTFLGRLPDDPSYFLIGLDFDRCFDPRTGRVAAWALSIIHRIASLTEKSPSGTGLKTFALARDADIEKLRELLSGMWGRSWKIGPHHGLELYLQGRYFAVTDQVWPEAISLAFDPQLRVVEYDTLRWLVEEAGPSLSGNPTSKQAGGTGQQQTGGRDESGSGYGLRFIIKQVTYGATYDQALIAVRADQGLAGAWARRSSHRELERTWQRALRDVEKHRIGQEMSAQMLTLDDVAGGDADKADDAPPGGWLAELNKKHAVVQIGGDTLIINTSTLSFSLSSFSSFRNLYSNRRVMVGNRSVRMADAWLEHPDRRQYDGVVFKPGENSGSALNLFTSWGVTPKAGCCQLILGHLLNIVCRGNRQHFDWLIGFFAHMVQRPWEKPGVAIVLRGKKGVGKDTLGEYMRNIFGRHRVKVAQMEQLTSRFNKSFESALLIHAEEALWAGNRAAESALKNLITAEVVRIEPKGVDAIDVASVCRLLLSSNEDWVVPATEDERRFFVLDASSKYSVRESSPGERKKYFDQIYAERDRGGAEALLAHLLQVNLDGFNFRQPPETSALSDQKVASLRGVGRFWFDILQGGVFPAQNEDHDWSKPISFKLDGLYQHYSAYCARRRYEGDPIPLNMFGQKLKELCPGVRSKTVWRGKKSIWRHEAPSLPECRRAMEVRVGGAIDWPGDDGLDLI